MVYGDVLEEVSEEEYFKGEIGVTHRGDKIVKLLVVNINFIFHLYN